MKNENQKHVRNAMIFFPVIVTLVIIGLNDPINFNKDYSLILLVAFLVGSFNIAPLFFCLIVMIPMVVYYNFWNSIIFGSISAGIGCLLYYFILKYKTNLSQESELDED